MKAQVFGDFIYTAGMILAIAVVAISLVLSYEKFHTSFINITNSNTVIIGTNGQTPNSILSDVGNNLYASDQYIVMIFGIMNVIIILFAGLLNSDPRGWAIGLFVMVFFVFIFAIISNVSHAIFGSSVFSSVIGHFGLTTALFAQLPVYEIVFIFIYLLIIASRAVFFRPQG